MRIAQICLLSICLAQLQAGMAEGFFQAPQAAGAVKSPFVGLTKTAGEFPIAVWLQDPANAQRFRDTGINLYVGLWRGPTPAHLDALDKAGMRLICSQNERSMAFRDRPTIVGWMHGDEPDNAQSLPQGKGYGPPILPSVIIKDYEAIRKADPDRPVLLNLGQGVAWDGYYGRGVRTNHPEDYREYGKGSDIVSFDIYPAAHENKAIAGKLWYVPYGVERLRKWTDDKKDVWCCIETTGINNVNRRPTPGEVRSEVWMALIHGAKGLIYFSNQFKPKFIEAGLLADQAIAAEVKSINRQIQSLSAVLRSPSLTAAASIELANAQVPVASMVKRHDGKTYIFAAGMRNGQTDVRLNLPGSGQVEVEVIGENRTIQATGGTWNDHFSDYQVHIYAIGKSKM